MSKEILRPVFAGMGLLASLALVGCGGSGQSRPGGTGGTTGNGGSSSTGGSTGTGGATGAGGMTALGTLNCNPGLNPTSATITTFTSGTDWSIASGKWGVLGGLMGSIYSYSGPSSGSWHAGVDTTNSLLDIGVLAGTSTGPGNVAAGDYAGGGMMFNECVDTSNYTGISFTLGGSNATCDVYFQFKTFDEQASSQGGGCDAGCYSFPQEKIVTGSQNISDVTNPIIVHFSDVTGGGKPDGAPISMQLVGLQWQLQSSTPVADAGQTGCTGAELTIGNVMFVQ